MCLFHGMKSYLGTKSCPRNGYPTLLPFIKPKLSSSYNVFYLNVVRRCYFACQRSELSTLIVIKHDVESVGIDSDRSFRLRISAFRSAAGRNKSLRCSSLAFKGCHCVSFLTLLHCIILPLQVFRPLLTPCKCLRRDEIDIGTRMC